MKDFAQRVNKKKKKNKSNKAIFKSIGIAYNVGAREGHREREGMGETGPFLYTKRAGEKTRAEKDRGWS